MWLYRQPTTMRKHRSFYHYIVWQQLISTDQGKWHKRLSCSKLWARSAAGGGGGGCTWTAATDTTLYKLLSLVIRPFSSSPQSAKRIRNIGLMLGQRQRRWLSIESMSLLGLPKHGDRCRMSKVIRRMDALKVVWPRQQYSSKHEALSQCWIIVGPASKTMGHQWTSIGRTRRPVYQMSELSRAQRGSITVLCVARRNEIPRKFNVFK